MPPWPRSSADAASALAVAGAIALGLAAEHALYGLAEVRDWLPDLLTGWILIGCGLLTVRRKPTPGVLLTAAGGLWFVGNLAGHGTYLLHRGPLAQVLLTFPGRRPAGRLEASAVALAYAGSVVAAFAWGDVATLGLAVLLAVTAAIRQQRAVGKLRRERDYGLRGAGFLALALALVAGTNLLVDTSEGRRLTLLCYQATLAAVAVYAAYGIQRRPWERPAVTDLVVDIGETRAEPVREALARALGDPTLTVAYRIDGRDGYVDVGGRPLELPSDLQHRRLTRVGRDGREVAVLIHDAAVLDDPALLEAVSAAARLAAVNAALQAEVRAQVEGLEASRRRLLETADRERRRLERRLHEGAVRRLDLLDTVLETAQGNAGSATAARIEDARRQLARAAGELREIGAGLHPHELVEHGLAVALASLTRRSAVPIELTVSSARLPDETEAAVYFVCSEALANVAKHAKATHVSIVVTAASGAVHVEIRDDGGGGADPAHGTGLRGLADRVEALAGTLEVADVPAGGTRLVVDLPA